MALVAVTPVGGLGAVRRDAGRVGMVAATAPLAPAVRDSLQITTVSGPRRTSVQFGTPAAPIGHGHLAVPHRFQGEDSSCGPSSLWMVMSYHLGVGAVDFRALDDSMRPTGRLTNTVGTVPTSLAEHARAHGLAATVTNNATTDDLRRMIDQGLPVILQGTWTDGKDKDLHFVVVTGYEGNDDRTAHWDILDPYVDADTAVVQSTADLQRFWSDMRLLGLRHPYQHSTVNVAPKERAKELPADNRSAGIKVMDRTVILGTDILRFFDNKR